MNHDFRDLLSEFNAHRVEFLVVGAHALAAHGHVRATKDMDLWVRPNRENAARVLQALASFGAFRPHPLTPSFHREQEGFWSASGSADIERLEELGEKRPEK